MPTQTENELPPKMENVATSKYFPTFKKILSRKFNFRKLIKRIAIIVVVMAALINIKDEIEYKFGLGVWGEDENYQEEATSANENCNVSGITLHGNLVTYITNENYDWATDKIIADQVGSEDIVYAIEEANEDDTIKAILLEIDSYGGSPVGAEEIADALKRSTKPTVAVIREGGVSAGYYAATGANIIFASKNSDVGSIGVTYSYLDNTIKNQKEGLVYQELNSGKFKDTGDPNKPLTNEEKELYKRDIKIIYENFIKAVTENRKLDINKVRALADGSTMLGEMALKNGLIDQIGGQAEAEEYLTEKIGEEAEVCW